MILITDSNIIYSALINPNGTIAIIFKQKSNLQFTAPDYLIQEVKEHWDKILEFTPLSKKELQLEWEFLKKKIKFIKTDDISKKDIKKSLEIVRDVDYYDTFFVALHFHTGHKIWTGDKELIKGVTAKGYDIFITTEELKEKLYKK